MQNFIYLLFFLPLFLGRSDQAGNRMINGNFTSFTVDNLNNVYVVTQDNSIQKYNDTLHLQFTNNFKLYGNLYNIDVTNPLEILLFYKGANVAVLTDNTLSKIGVVDFNKLGFYQVRLCAHSSLQSLWILDGQDFRLKKLDQKGNVIFQSDNLYFYFREKGLNPSDLKEIDKRVYLNIPEKGIVVFDVYGNYLKTIPLQNIRTFTVYKNVLYFYDDGSFKTYNLQTLQENALDLQVAGTKIIKTANFFYNQYYFLSDKGLIVIKENE